MFWTPVLGRHFPWLAPWRMEDLRFDELDQVVAVGDELVRHAERAQREAKRGR